MALLTILQYTGAVLGVLGALLVTSCDQKKRYAAFSIWFCSNIILITYFVGTSQWGCLGQNSFYLGTTIIGLYNNRPRKDIR